MNYNLFKVTARTSETIENKIPMQRGMVYLENQRRNAVKNGIKFKLFGDNGDRHLVILDPDQTVTYTLVKDEKYAA